MPDDFDLRDIFSPDLIFIHPQLKTKEEVFEFIATKLQEAGEITVDQVKTIVAALKERESLGSTGIGKEIAIPHITCKGITKLIGSALLIEEGIDWGSLDGKPVRLLVFLFAPEEKRDEYLSTLAEVARVLHIPEQLKGILRAKNPDNIYELLTGIYKEQRFIRYQRFLYFGVGLIIFFLLAKITFTHVKIPPLPIYQKLGALHFNEPFWINREIFSTTLFFSMVLGTLLFFQYRVAIGGLALSLLLISGVMDIEMTVKFMSIPTILFIIAVMVIVKWLEEKGVFKFLVLHGLRYFHNSPWLLFSALMLFSALLAGLVDEVSAILITLGIAVEIARRTKVGVIPYLLSLVMATNIGSALTLIGNPIGIYLGFASKLTFLDFLKNSTPIAITTVLIVILIALLFYRREVKKSVGVDIKELEEKVSIPSKGELRLAIIVFLLFITLVVFHTFLEKLLQVEERTVLLALPLGIVGFIVFKEQERGRYLIEKGPDWWTILYFMCLFASAACLEYTGVTVKIAYLLTKAAKLLPLTLFGNLAESASILTFLLWGSGLFSGFVDNLPIVAALVPVVKNLVASGMPGANLFWWSLLIGGCFGGNLTMIGSTANLVAIGVYERSYRRHFPFKRWLFLGIIVTFVSLFFANCLLLLKLRTNP